MKKKEKENHRLTIDENLRIVSNPRACDPSSNPDSPSLGACPRVVADAIAGASALDLVVVSSIVGYRADHL